MLHLRGVRRNSSAKIDSANRAYYHGLLESLYELFEADYKEYQGIDGQAHPRHHHKQVRRNSKS